MPRRDASWVIIRVASSSVSGPSRTSTGIIPDGGVGILVREATNTRLFCTWRAMKVDQLAELLAG